MSGAIFSPDQQAFLARMRVARLATADAAGQPHVIPIVFAADDQNVYSPLDEKPKRVAPSQVKRVRNLLANPQVGIVVDEYHEDWTRLVWMMVTGTATVVEDGESHAAGVRLLEEKYPQYRMMPLASRPIIVVTPRKVTTWKANNRL